MTLSKTCRAKNPARCRVHGNVSLIPIISNSSYAATLLSLSEENLGIATNLEEMIEAQQARQKDQELYDMTAEGIKDLRRTIIRPGNKYADQINAKQRIEKAYESRSQLLEQVPELKNSFANYSTFVKENATEVGTISIRDDSGNLRPEAREALENIVPGTPVAIKTRGGDIIYDTASDGLLYAAKRGKLTKLLQGGEGTFYDRDGLLGEHLSIRHSNIALNVDGIKEVTPLKPGTLDNGIPDSLKSEGKVVDMREDVDTNSNVQAIEGDNYYYQVAATRSPANPGKKGTGAMLDIRGVSEIWIQPVRVKKASKIA